MGKILEHREGAVWEVRTEEKVMERESVCATRGWWVGIAVCVLGVYEVICRNQKNLSDVPCLQFAIGSEETGGGPIY